MGSTTQPILQAQDLSIGYKLNSKRLRKVAGPLQLEMHPGQLICLLGPNGAGKSTLIRTLSGLQPMLEGRVVIAGESISRLKPAAMARKLSMVLTDNVRSGNLDVYSLVALGRYPYTGWLGTLSAADKKIIHWAIEATNTEAFIHRKMDQLSDGESQKVMLARALAQDTPLVILDEPTAHLDLPNRVQLLRLLHQLAKQTNKAILISTHELDMALQVGDQVWLLAQGGQLTTGVPEDLVLNGSFEAAFDKAGFNFDKETGTFNIHQGAGQKVNLVGHGAAAFWTRRALQREGYIVATDTAEAVCTIKITEQNNGCLWVSTQEGSYQEHPTIAALLSSLRAAADTPSIHREQTEKDKA
ncbi:ABC transporter ATP-binding protein [Pontibacter silvestris]|uniref:ABC transporter ATP-binding protein n=1 Tax=Pontibacter silvestris TaxID=2305183 RepID=A0ABW4X1A3_9BACT|nr:ABC transporter ATP-binding protein [Pontibacter silvestris]MCC9138211.1 ABC transporter ATP-binding protein [Pontibacter silvestris]